MRATPGPGGAFGVCTTDQDPAKETGSWAPTTHAKRPLFKDLRVLDLPPLIKANPLEQL